MLHVERLVSLHFPKAGGTSLVTQLEALLPDQVALDFDHDPLTEAGRETAAFPPGKRVVHGHFTPHRYPEPAVFRATFLRDPVENLISIYYYWLTFASGSNPVHAKFLAEKPDIVSFARYPVFSTLMSGTYFGGFDMRRFDFIGFHETRERDVPMLGRALGLPLRSDVHENSTPLVPEREALRTNEEVRRRLGDVLTADVNFYERLRGCG